MLFKKTFIPTFDEFLETSLYPVHDIATWSTGVFNRQVISTKMKKQDYGENMEVVPLMQIENEEARKTAKLPRKIYV